MNDSAVPRAENDWNDQVVRIYIDDMGYFQGIVIEVTSSTVCVDFPVDFAPGLSINQDVSLSFTAARIGSSLKVPSRVVYMGEDEFRIRQRFEIGDESRIALSTLIEARSEFRVSPPECAPVFVSPDRADSEVEGALDNYSSTGLSVVLHKDDTKVLESACRLRFRLLLPEAGQYVTLIGHVRACEDLVEHTRLGVEIEGTGAPEVMREHERFGRHVRYLQSEILQRLSAARRSGRAKPNKAS
jgi:hypothetical protein